MSTIPIYNMADTWNAIGTTFNGIYMNFTDGAGGAPVGAAASRFLRLDSDGVSVFEVAASGALVSTGGMNIGGHLIWTADNTYDIGASGATRPRNLFVASNGTIGGFLVIGAAEQFAFSGRVAITAPAVGSVRLTNNDQNDFGLLQFGGTTSSFPALKRSSTSLQVRLADDSADAQLDVGALRVNQAPTANTSAATTITNGADSNTNLGHRASFNMNGTTYWFPCGSVAF